MKLAWRSHSNITQIIYHLHLCPQVTRVQFYFSNAVQANLNGSRKKLNGLSSHLQVPGEWSDQFWCWTPLWICKSLTFDVRSPRHVRNLCKLPTSRSSWSCHGRLQHWALCLAKRKQLKLCRHLWLLFEASVTNPHGITWTKFDKSAAQRQLFVKTQFGCTSLGGRLRHEPNLWIHPKDRRWSNTACFPMVHESSWSKNSCKSLRFPNSHCIYFTWSQNWYHWQFRSTKLFLQNCQVFQKEKFFLPAPLSSSP